ncbi:MAG: glycosyltransferase family 8 protein [Alphaproteobacteria bacterium]|nr:glycosyltransferase family 8 protein [Alphaproteobacteria bacterium]
MTKEIDIAFITDDNYAIPTAVAITSLIQNKNAESLYNIYVVTTAISAENVNLFKQFNQTNININIIEASVAKFAGIHKRQKNSVCVASEAALLKFELPNLLKRCTKVLYLDGDIIVKHDVSELYQTNIDSYMCAAVYDTGCLYSSNPKFKKFTKYFNSGVMVLNLQKMRKENISEKLYLAKKKSTDFNLMDQDVFNEVFNHQVKILDIKYNCLIINLRRAQDKYKFDNLNKLFKANYSSLQNIEDNAIILHFSSKDKPWYYTDAEYSILWNEYFLKSPYSKVLMKKRKIKQEKGIRYPVIISLTSYPARISTVNQTIVSLLTQTIKADKVILWLAEEQFPHKEADLPKELLTLKDKGLTIDWYHDIKSFKKLIPTLKNYPDAIVVTADDDLLYSREWLEIMLIAYLKNPHSINCHRAHLISFKEEKILPYCQWPQNIRKSNTQYNSFPTSGAGVLYPPHCLAQDVLDEKKFMNLCPQADDIWFWAMAVKNNTPIKVVENNITKLNFIDGTQETALWHTNVIEGQNDIQLQNVLCEYPEILDNLDKTVSATHCQNEKQNSQKYIITYKFLKYIPLWKYKKRGGNQVWKILGLPIWRKRDFADNQSVKYYLFGLPLLEIEKQGYNF